MKPFFSLWRGWVSGQKTPPDNDYITKLLAMPFKHEPVPVERTAHTLFLLPPNITELFIIQRGAVGQLIL